MVDPYVILKIVKEKELISMYDVYDMVVALVEFLEIEDEENIGVWSDDSLTYEGIEYELYREENDKWSKLLGVHNGWFIYQTDNPV